MLNFFICFISKQFVLFCNSVEFFVLLIYLKIVGNTVARTTGHRQDTDGKTNRKNAQCKVKVEQLPSFISTRYFCQLIYTDQNDAGCCFQKTNQCYCNDGQFHIRTLLHFREPKIVNGPEILDKYVGESEANIRKLFQEAEDDEKKLGEQHL